MDKWVAILAIAILIFSSYDLKAQMLFNSTVTAATQSPVNNPPAGALIVPENYQTIQAAIDNASAGETVFVEKGTYEGGIEITKPLTLIGQEENKTIIDYYSQIYDPEYFPPIITVAASNVKISGFTLAGGETGIHIQSGNKIKIIQNNLINITLLGGMGIYNDYASNNLVIYGNNITNDYGAIQVADGNNLLISHNTIANNTYTIGVNGGKNGVISDNTIVNNSFGISFEDTSNLNVDGNNISDNIGNSQSSNELGYGLQFLWNCNNSVIRDNNIDSNKIGIDLKNFESVAGNVSIEQGSGNRVYQNNIVANTQNVKVEDNSFDTTSPTETTIVSWDNGKVGNYWSDYLSKYPNAVEIDASGIGNTPYVIDQNNIDQYPLLHQVNITAEEPVSGISLPAATIIALVAVLIVATALFLYTRYRTKKK